MYESGIGSDIAQEYVIFAEGISRSDLRQLVTEHFEEMVSTSAPESSHALDLDELSHPAITLFTLRQDDQLLGCGAIKELDVTTGELKTMRTVEAIRGQGIGGRLLDFLIDHAQKRGYSKLYLETGSEDFFQRARAMYQSRGFKECGPFGNYVVDPHSVFMVLSLD